MIKRKLIFFFSLLFLVVFGLSLSSANGGSPKESSSATVENAPITVVEVKIPDGVYLYSSNFKNLEKKVFSPLVLVKDGKFTDPYVLTKETGIQHLKKEYIAEKEFSVYRGTEKISKISCVNVALKNTCKIGDFTVPEFLSDVVSDGSFIGSQKPAGSFSVKRDKNTVFGATEIIIVPEAYQTKVAAIFTAVTDGEKNKMIDSFRQKLLPTVWKELEDSFVKKSKRHIVSEGNSRLFAGTAIDLDGNGKKDYVGIYNLTVKDSSKGLTSLSTLFVLWDTGKIEKIVTDNLMPAFGLIGVIDIDQDGIQELVFQRVVEVYREGLYTGRQIVIVRHDSSGWKYVYRSKPICGPILMY